VYHVTIYPFIDNSTFPIGILQYGGEGSGGGGGDSGGSSSSNISFFVRVPSSNSSNISVSKPYSYTTSLASRYEPNQNFYYTLIVHSISIPLSTINLIINVRLVDVGVAFPYYGIPQGTYGFGEYPYISLSRLNTSNVQVSGYIQTARTDNSNIVSSNFGTTLSNDTTVVFGGAFQNTYMKLFDSTNNYIYTVELNMGGSPLYYNTVVLQPSSFISVNISQES
jgi:hypothetical protein